MSYPGTGKYKNHGNCQYVPFHEVPDSEEVASEEQLQVTPPPSHGWWPVIALKTTFDEVATTKKGPRCVLVSASERWDRHCLVDVHHLIGQRRWSGDVWRGVLWCFAVFRRADPCCHLVQTTASKATLIYVDLRKFFSGSQRDAGLTEAAKRWCRVSVPQSLKQASSNMRARFKQILYKR